MVCNSCKKYLVLPDMQAVGLCVHCLALAGKDKEIADLKAQVATADALVTQAISDGEKDCEDLQAQVEWLANKCMDMDKLHGQRTNLWWIEMAKNRAGGE